MPPAVMGAGAWAYLPRTRRQTTMATETWKMLLMMWLPLLFSESAPLRGGREKALCDGSSSKVASKRWVRKKKILKTTNKNWGN